MISSSVLLFGLLVSLSYYIRTWPYVKKINVISFVLTDIILKDILSFFLTFFSVVISFTLAIHMLRESSLFGDSTGSDTWYRLFVSALTFGGFIEETFDSSPVHFPSARLLMRIMFVVYLCCTTIILINILISMMNHSYEKARKKAKNVRRFQSLRSGLWLIRVLSRFFKRVNYFTFIQTILKYKIGRFWFVGRVISINEKDGRIFLHVQR